MSNTLHVLANQTLPPPATINVCWWRYFDAVACPEDEGGYSVFGVHYPGVISQGETLDEAKANIAEAFLAMRDVVGEDLEYSESPCVEVGPESRSFRVKVRV